MILICSNISMKYIVIFILFLISITRSHAVETPFPSTIKVLNKTYKKTNHSELMLPQDASTMDWLKLINDFDEILNKL